MPIVKQIPCTAATTGLLRRAVTLQPQVERIDEALVARHGLLATLVELGHRRQVDAAGEVIACRVEHGHAQRRVVVQAGEGLGELAQHARTDAVSLGRPVEPDEQDGAGCFDVDAAFWRWCGERG